MVINTAMKWHILDHKAACSASIQMRYHQTVPNTNDLFEI